MFIERFLGLRSLKFLFYIVAKNNVIGNEKGGEEQ